MRIVVPKEIRPGETRVAATADSVTLLVKMGFSVAVEADAGVGAGVDDAAYAAAGATIVSDVRELWGQGDLVLKIAPPAMHPTLGCHEAELMREGAMIASFIQSDLNPELLPALAKRRATVLAMEKVPRITRAQKMDALSSMANLAGYRAIIEAANHFGSFFCGQFTAAGKVPPARVLVIGAGVAGLAAIGAARGLGADVRAFDTRAAAREQVESMGATFLEVTVEEDGEGGGGYAKVMSQAFIDAEMALFRAQALEVDIVVTTALIPGRKAPKLWLADMVESMKPGSIIVDLASSHGGNCDLTVPGQHVVHNGVHILGATDLTQQMAPVASRLYARNLTHLLDDLTKDGEVILDPMDDVVRGAVLQIDGVAPTWPEKEAPVAPTAPSPGPSASAAAAAPKPKREPRPATTKAGHGGHGGHGAPADAGDSKLGIWLASGAVAGLAVLWMALTGGGQDASTAASGQAFLQHLTVFVLSCVVGWHVVWNVSPALHTPLMSVTNAISGIIVLGGLLHLATASHGDAAALVEGSALVKGLGLAAVALATINIAGGFLVTRRMLAMFRK
jgi:H+-translocating NAD(P) transhydrogenase subunit alpha